MCKFLEYQQSECMKWPGIVEGVGVGRCSGLHKCVGSCSKVWGGEIEIISLLTSSFLALLYCFTACMNKVGA